MVVVEPDPVHRRRQGGAKSGGNAVEPGLPCIGRQLPFRRREVEPVEIPGILPHSGIAPDPHPVQDGSHLLTGGWVAPCRTGQERIERFERRNGQPADHGHSRAKVA